MQIDLNRQEVQDIMIAIATQREEEVGFGIRPDFVAALDALYERFSIMDDRMADYASDVEASS